MKKRKKRDLGSKIDRGIKLYKKLYKLENEVGLLHIGYYNGTIQESLYLKLITRLEKRIDDILKMKNY
ncbi:MAG: hypothetical protein WC356_01925 [Candidatus Micrarchaeia archaeon]|jgi:hypothetical protein